MLYRLFTENKNYDQIKKLVNQYFPGFTVIKVDGVWHGVAEHSLIIEIDDDNITYTDIKGLCYNLKKLNQQDKILVQRIESESKLV